MKSKILEGGMKIEVEHSFMRIDNSMMNFCSFLTLNTIDIWMFPDKLEDYINYKNRTDKDYTDIRSFGSFNYELKIRVNGVIYLVLCVNLRLVNREWRYKYTEIIITDKNGVIIEEIQ